MLHTYADHRYNMKLVLSVLLTCWKSLECGIVAELAKACIGWNSYSNSVLPKRF